MPGTWLGEGSDGDGSRDPFNPADAIASQASFMCQLYAAITNDKSLTGDPIDLAEAGLDFGTPVGTPIHAASNGTVIAAGTASGLGQWSLAS